MYGLVNKAIEQMVCGEFSHEAWAAIKQRAGLADDVFVSMRPYPDELTYALVDAAHQLLGLEHSAILRAFGRYWVLYTAAEGYGELLKLTGGSLREFLRNLDNMHARVGLSYPQLRPPSFVCADLPEGGMLLHYYSEREGLAPMVIGLLEGLAERFQTPMDIALAASRAQGDDHEVFRITFCESSL